MANPNLTIRIKAEADLSEAKEAQKAIDGIERAGKKTETQLDEIEVPAPLPGAKEAKKAVEDIGKAGEKTADDLKEITIEDIMPGFGATKAQAEKLARDTKAAANTAADSSGGGLTSGGVAGGVLAAELATRAAVLGAAAVREFVDQLSAGVQRAADMAVELQGMDEAARAAALAGLGPLGALIAQNSPLLVELSRDLAQAKGKMDEMWTAAGVGLAPALASVADNLAKVDVVTFGQELGETAGGVVALAENVGAFVLQVDKANGGTGQWGDAIARLSPVLAKAGSNVVEFLQILNDQAAYEQAFDPARIADQEARRLEAMKRAQGELDAYRLEAARSLEEKLAALKTKQEASTDGGEKIRIEQEIQAVQKRIDAEKNAEYAKQRQIKLTLEQIDLENRLAVAKAEGNAADEKKIQWQLDYNAILEKTGRVYEARKFADDKADARAKMAIAAAQKLADAEAAADKARAKAEADKTESENRSKAAKEESLALQTKLNEAIAAGNKDEAERVRWLQEYNRLQQQGISEESARAAANASSAARVAKGETPAAARAEAPISRDPTGRASAPTVRGSVTSSTHDAPIDINNPTAPRGLAPELTPRGSAGTGTGPGAPIPPAPGTATPAGQPPGTEPGSPGGAEQISAALKAAQDQLDAAIKALLEGAKALAEKHIKAVGDLQKAQESSGEQITGAVKGASSASLAKGHEIIAELNNLKSQIQNLSV